MKHGLVRISILIVILSVIVGTGSYLFLGQKASANNNQTQDTLSDQIVISENHDVRLITINARSTEYKLKAVFPDGREIENIRFILHRPGSVDAKWHLKIGDLNDLHHNGVDNLNVNISAEELIRLIANLLSYHQNNNIGQMQYVEFELQLVNSLWNDVVQVVKEDALKKIGVLSMQEGLMFEPVSETLRENPIINDILAQFDKYGHELYNPAFGPILYFQHELQGAEWNYISLLPNAGLRRNSKIVFIVENQFPTQTGDFKTREDFKLAPNGLPYSDTFISAYFNTEHEDEFSSEDIPQFAIAWTSDTTNTSNVNTCAIRVACALKASGIPIHTVPDSKPFDEDFNDGARISLEARAIWTTLQETGVGPTIPAASNPTFSDIRNNLLEGQVAIATTPEIFGGTQYVGVVAQDYTDYSIQGRIGDVWILPVRN